MNKIVIVNKEPGMTSHDVVNKMRRIFNTKKVGHIGTLDPDASGVLVICLNEATKLVQFLENDSKEYIAEIIIGKSTDTFDASGNTTKEVLVDYLDNDMIDQCLNKFKGKIEQIPPIYSAIKVKGKKLYEYARINQEVEIKSRTIEIYNLDRISDVERIGEFYKFKIKAFVSKGTYIRSLCVDICNALGFPGHMNSLIRTKSGVWTLEESSILSQIGEGNYRSFTMLEALKNLPQIDDEECVLKALHGMKISPSKILEILNYKPHRIIIKKDNQLIAIYELDHSINGYRALRVWN